MSQGTRVLVCSLVLGFFTMAGTGSAMAQMSPSELTPHRGKIVWLERNDGRLILVRLLDIEGRRAVVELEDGSLGSIHLDSIAAVLLRANGERPALQPRRKTSRATPPRFHHEHDPEPDRPRQKRRFHKMRVEWVTIRALVGGSGWGVAGGGDLVLFSLHWRHFFWEILKIGGGMPTYGHWGTAIGYPFHLDNREQHELRLGVHFTFYFGYLPTASGLQLIYQYRPYKHFGFQIGIVQYSWPFALNLVIGLAF